MHSIRRWLNISLSLFVFALTGIPGWTSPFHEMGADAVLAQGQNQPKHRSFKSATYTGTIVREGERYVLQETSGNIYTLDDSERAKTLEGKAAKVTGILDKEAKLIHVEWIEVYWA